VTLSFHYLLYRSDSLPLDEIQDVYLLDFVGPPGFVEDIALKVERSVSISTHFSYLKFFFFLESCVFLID
jgi:hypothetical protein